MGIIRDELEASKKKDNLESGKKAKKESNKKNRTNGISSVVKNFIEILKPKKPDTSRDYAKSNVNESKTKAKSGQNKSYRTTENKGVKTRKNVNSPSASNDYDLAHRFQDGIDTWPGKHTYTYSVYRGKESGNMDKLNEVMRLMDRKFKIIKTVEKNHEYSQMHSYEVHYEVFETNGTKKNINSSSADKNSILKYELDKLKGIKPDYPVKKTFEEMTRDEQNEVKRLDREKLLRQADELDRQADATRERLDRSFGNDDF